MITCISPSIFYRIRARHHAYAPVILPMCKARDLLGEDPYPMSERTLAIIKPDAVKKNIIGEVIGRYEKAGLRPVAMKMMQLSKPTAQGFYAVHKARPFFDSLCAFMSSGPVVVLVLQGENAIKKNRELMGATDPAKADAGTLRKLYGTNIEFNAVHGSDSPETVSFEVGYFFPEMEVVG